MNILFLPLLCSIFAINCGGRRSFGTADAESGLHARESLSPTKLRRI